VLLLSLACGLTLNWRKSVDGSVVGSGVLIVSFSFCQECHSAGSLMVGGGFWRKLDQLCRNDKIRTIQSHKKIQKILKLLICADCVLGERN